MLDEIILKGRCIYVFYVTVYVCGYIYIYVGKDTGGIIILIQ